MSLAYFMLILYILSLLQTKYVEYKDFFIFDQVPLLKAETVELKYTNSFIIVSLTCTSTQEPFKFEM